MKKVLCGLVIALMMTGSGYASVVSENCGFLRHQAHTHIKLFRESDKDTNEKFIKQYDHHIGYGRQYAELLRDLCER